MSTNFFSWIKVLVLFAVLLGFASTTLTEGAEHQFNEQILPFDGATDVAAKTPFPDDPTFERYVGLADYLQAFYRADADQLAEYAISAAQAESILFRGRKDIHSDMLGTVAIRMAIVTGNRQVLVKLSSVTQSLGKDKLFKETTEALAALDRITKETDAVGMTASAFFSSPFYAIPAFFAEDMSPCFLPEINPQAALQEDKKAACENLQKEWSKGYKKLAEYAAQKPLPPEVSKALARIQTTVASGVSTRLSGEERGYANQLIVGRWEMDGGRRAAIDAEGNYTAYTPAGYNVFTYQFDPWDNYSGFLTVYDTNGRITGRFSVYFRGSNIMEWSGEGVRRVYYRR